MVYCMSPCHSQIFPVRHEFGIQDKRKYHLWNHQAAAPRSPCHLLIYGKNVRGLASGTRPSTTHNPRPRSAYILASIVFYRPWSLFIELGHYYLIFLKMTWQHECGPPLSGCHVRSYIAKYATICDLISQYMTSHGNPDREIPIRVAMSFLAIPGNSDRPDRDPPKGTEIDFVGCEKKVDRIDTNRYPSIFWCAAGKYDIGGHRCAVSLSTRVTDGHQNFGVDRFSEQVFRWSTSGITTAKTNLY